MHGLGPGEPISRDSFLEHLHPEDREPTRQALRRALHEGSRLLRRVSRHRRPMAATVDCRERAGGEVAERRRGAHAGRVHGHHAAQAGGGTVPPGGGSLAQRNRIGGRRRPGGPGQRGDREALRLHTWRADGNARRDVGAGTASRRPPWPPAGIPRRAARAPHGPRTGALRPPQGRDGVRRRNRIEPDLQRGDGPLVLAAIVDVTARRKDEAEMARLRAELAHAGRISTMAQLASGLAHELSQPLGAILRNAEAAELLLQERHPGPGGGARHPRRHLQGRPPRGRGHRPHAGPAQAARPGTRRAFRRGAGGRGPGPGAAGRGEPQGAAGRGGLKRRCPRCVAIACSCSRCC